MGTLLIRTRCKHCLAKVKYPDGLRQFTCPRCLGGNVLLSGNPASSAPTGATFSLGIHPHSVGQSPTTDGLIRAPEPAHIGFGVWIVGGSVGVLGVVAFRLLQPLFGSGGLLVVLLSATAVFFVVLAILYVCSLQLASPPRSFR